MKLQNKRGQGMVEFSLTVPLFFMITLAGVYGVFSMAQYHGLYHAAKAGVHTAITSNSTDEQTIIGEIKKTVEDVLTVSKIPYTEIHVRGLEASSAEEPIVVTISSNLRLLSLEEGFHAFNVSASGYRNLHSQIEIVAGRGDS